MSPTPTHVRQRRSYLLFKDFLDWLHMKPGKGEVFYINRHTWRGNTKEFPAVAIPHVQSRGEPGESLGKRVLWRISLEHAEKSTRSGPWAGVMAPLNARRS